MIINNHRPSVLGRRLQKALQVTFKLFTRILVMAVVLGCIVIGSFMVRGYRLYQAAVKEKGLEARIEAIEEKENYVALNDISSEFTGQLIESEDKHFYQHGGIDVGSTLRAVVTDIKAGAFVQGGSTITQQLAKNLCFTSEKKIERKIAELFVVYKLEKEYSKDKLLELYCNIIYFGENCYGIQDAAANYYGVNASELSKTQASCLVFTIKCPNYYNPNVYMKKKEAD